MGRERLIVCGVWIVLGACGDGSATSASSIHRTSDVASARADGTAIEVVEDTSADVAEDSAIDVAEVEETVRDVAEVADTTVVDDGPTRYPAGAVHSPLTAAVVANLTAIAARAPTAHDDVLAKVGDSITVSRAFMACLADPAVDFQGHSELEATRDAFTSDSFGRESLAAMSGKTAAWAMTAGTDGKTPIDQELAATAPRFALVMYGTNDIGYWPDDFPRMFRWYGENMIALVDRLTGAGVVPILSSIPPRLDSRDVLDPRVASVNELVRGLAQAFQIPFVDFHLALSQTGDWGMSSDGVHPRAACDDGNVRCGCRFDASGLESGYDVRNWISLEALERVRGVVAGGSAAPDVAVRAPLAGHGTADDPFVIDQLPFSDWRDSASGTNVISHYDGCGAAQDESGPEIYYRLSLATKTPIAAIVVDRAGVDVDVHLMGSTSAADCRARNDSYLEDELDAGSWTFVLDTFVSGGVAQSGDYLFVVLAR